MHFTCTAVQFTSLSWSINGEEVADRFLFRGSNSHTFPETLDKKDRFSGTDITVTIVSVTVLTSADNLTFVSTLDTDLTTLSQLQAQNITCGSHYSMDIKNITFTLKGKAVI